MSRSRIKPVSNRLNPGRRSPLAVSLIATALAALALCPAALEGQAERIDSPFRLARKGLPDRSVRGLPRGQPGRARIRPGADERDERQDARAGIESALARTRRHLWGPPTAGPWMSWPRADPRSSIRWPQGG